MARNLYIDTDSRQFVQGANNAAVKIQGPYFKGDTETLNLYFLERTGVIGTPYSYSDKSSSTAKVSWGTLGQSSILSVTGFSALSTSVIVGVTISQAATANTNEIKQVTFLPIPQFGFWSLYIPTTGTTAESTGSLDFDISASSLQQAIQGLPSIANGGYNNVFVNKIETGKYLIEFAGTNASRTMPTLVAISNLSIAPGLTATVGITSAAITSLLSGTTSSPVTVEVELTTSGNKLTAAQGDATLAVALSH
jgi:hypothetical protein